MQKGTIETTTMLGSVGIDLAVAIRPESCAGLPKAASCNRLAVVLTTKPFQRNSRGREGDGIIGGLQFDVAEQRPIAAKAALEAQVFGEHRV